jgi:riboflavin biosynthesis pyrimidine reductase
MAVVSTRQAGGRLHRLTYLTITLACLRHRTVHGESAISAKVDARPVKRDLGDVNAPLPFMDETSIQDDAMSEADTAAIQCITSQISDWMDGKRQQRDRSKLQAKLSNDKSQLKFVALAFAQTLDGMIAVRMPNYDEDSTPASSSSLPLLSSNLQLSCPQSNILTHKLRNMHDAVLVGSSTFLHDTPRLNVRLDIPSSIMRESLIEQPIPVVLDSHLTALQTLLWGRVIPVVDTDEVDTNNNNNKMPSDMHPENIRASNPILCCSPSSAKLFLDHLESFQTKTSIVKKDEFPGQLNRIRSNKRIYKITVYKMIDVNNHEEDMFLPIKISIEVRRLEGHKVENSSSSSRGEDNASCTTFTLLPCPLLDDGMLDLQYVLRQLNRQFQIDSVMVEGGAGVLTSFMESTSAVVAASKGKRGNGSSKPRLVDCICATISPSFIGKKGLAALGGLDVVNSKQNDEQLVRPFSIDDGKFVSLGRDCTFLGRL